MKFGHLFLSAALCWSSQQQSSLGQTDGAFGGATQKDGTQPAQESSAINFRVLKQWQLDLGNRSIFYNRVVPPVLPTPSPTVPEAPPPPLSPEVLARLRERAAKKYIPTFFFATVYDHQLSELWWYDKAGQHRIFSNVDFNYFTGIAEIETADAIYSYFLILDNRSTDISGEWKNSPAAAAYLQELKQHLPAMSQFPAGRSGYLITEKPAPANSDIYATFDAMHAYFDAHRFQMISDYQQREAEYAAREQWAKEHPPIPHDTVINYWKEDRAPNRGGK